MKKIIFLFLCIPILGSSQCIQMSPCGGINNTNNHTIQATSLWLEQSFTAPQTGYGTLKFWIGVSGDEPVPAIFSLKKNDDIFFTDTVLVPAVNTVFLFCDIENWMTVSNIFFEVEENYSFMVEKINPTEMPWMIYSTTFESDVTGLGSGENNLNASGSTENTGSFGPMLAGETVCFFLRMNRPGDYDDDGEVSVLDLAILMEHFGQNNPQISLVGDSLVTVDDLQFFIGLYGQDCP